MSNYIENRKEQKMIHCSKKREMLSKRLNRSLNWQFYNFGLLPANCLIQHSLNYVLIGLYYFDFGPSNSSNIIDWSNQYIFFTVGDIKIMKVHLSTFLRWGILTTYTSDIFRTVVLIFIVLFHGTLNENNLRQGKTQGSVRNYNVCHLKKSEAYKGRNVTHIWE